MSTTRFDSGEIRRLISNGDTIRRLVTLTRFSFDVIRSGAGWCPLIPEEIPVRAILEIRCDCLIRDARRRNAPARDAIWLAMDD
jgi:hypothetical protein